MRLNCYHNKLISNALLTYHDFRLRLLLQNKEAIEARIIIGQVEVVTLKVYHIYVLFVVNTLRSFLIYDLSPGL
jgi:hypothetical protein